MRPCSSIQLWDLTQSNSSQSVTLSHISLFFPALGCDKGGLGDALCVERRDEVHIRSFTEWQISPGVSISIPSHAREAGLLVPGKREEKELPRNLPGLAWLLAWRDRSLCQPSAVT